MNECSCAASGLRVSRYNTLVFYPARCNNCGRCVEVCPHRVFIQDESRVVLANPDACMECGACRTNCPAEALQVDSGVGCATAMIIAALTRKEVSCDASGCCGGNKL